MFAKNYTNFLFDFSNNRNNKFSSPNKLVTISKKCFRKYYPFSSFSKEFYSVSIIAKKETNILLLYGDKLVHIFEYLDR